MQFTVIVYFYLVCYVIFVKNNYTNTNQKHITKDRKLNRETNIKQ